MNLTINKDGNYRCDNPICGSCRVNEHNLDNLLADDSLTNYQGLKLCIGCGHWNGENGIHDYCRPVIVARIATRFGGIDGEHHKQWIIDQMLRASLGDKYKDWVKKMNSDLDYDPWDVGTPP